MSRYYPQYGYLPAEGVPYGPLLSGSPPSTYPPQYYAANWTSPGSSHATSHSPTSHGPGTSYYYASRPERPPQTGSHQTYASPSQRFTPTRPPYLEGWGPGPDPSPSQPAQSPRAGGAFQPPHHRRRRSEHRTFPTNPMPRRNSTHSPPPPPSRMAPMLPAIQWPKRIPGPAGWLEYPHHRYLVLAKAWKTSELMSMIWSHAWAMPGLRDAQAARLFELWYHMYCVAIECPRWQWHDAYCSWAPRTDPRSRTLLFPKMEENIARWNRADECIREIFLAAARDTDGLEEWFIKWDERWWEFAGRCDKGEREMTARMELARWQRQDMRPWFAEKHAMLEWVNVNAVAEKEQQKCESKDWEQGFVRSLFDLEDSFVQERFNELRQLEADFDRGWFQQGGWAQAVVNIAEFPKYDRVHGSLADFSRACIEYFKANRYQD